MNETLIEILETVAEALDASPAEQVRLESELLEDPAAFGERHRPHLTEAQLEALGVVEV